MFIIEWIKTHRKTAIIAAAIVAFVALALGLSLGLTLPLKSVEIEGDLVLIQGENYTGGLNIKATTRAGLVHREDVLAGDLEGLDSSVAGEQEVAVTYKGKKVRTTVTVIAVSDVTMVLREGTLPSEYLPNEPFATTGVFDFYRTDPETGESVLFRSAPVSRAAAREFTSTYSKETPYQIKLYYTDDLWVDYAYTIPIRIATITLDNPKLYLYWLEDSASEVGQLTATVTYLDGKTEKINADSKGLHRENEPIVEEGEDGELHEYLIFSYEGEPFKVEVKRYASVDDLYRPKSVTLDLGGRTVYVVGESFDYAQAALSVEYENWPDTLYRISATSQNIILQESSEGAFVDLTDGSSPIVFTEVCSYFVVGRDHGKDSPPTPIFVISKEDASHPIAISTLWRGKTGSSLVKGEDLDFTDAYLTVIYGYVAENGTVYVYRIDPAPVPLTAEMVTGYDKNTAGTQEVTITYGGVSTTVTIIVTDPDPEIITYMEVTGIGSLDRTHWSSEVPELPEGASLYVEYGYGHSSETIPLSDPRIEISGFTPHVLEEQELTATYSGESTTFTIRIWDDSPNAEEGVVYFIAPRSITINVGDPLDLSGECTVYFSTGKVAHPTLAEALDAGGTCDGNYDVNEPDDYPVRYFYPGCANTDDFTWIHVVGVKLSRIRLDVENAKTTYHVGDSIDLEGVRLFLVYSDNHEEEVPSENITPSLFPEFTTAAIGEYDIPISYAGKTTRYLYSVIDE